MSALPASLRAALDRELEGAPRGALAVRARATSDAYRAGRPSAGVIREADDALAYGLTRMPATYAACAAVFEEAAILASGFRPRTLLDAGAGLGSASWAAVETWSSIDGVTWLDSNTSLLGLAGRLAAVGPAALVGAETRRLDLTATQDWPRADLVAASYVLAEIAPSGQAALTDALWAATDGLLALVEPGTPAGYARILAARSRLIAAGAHILAPCPHQADCPLRAPDWCHFSVRLARSRDHRMAKAAVVPFEDERFAYLLAARPGVTVAPPAPRVLASPRAAKPGIELKLCTAAGGVETRFVPRRDKPAHAVARRLDWGDRLPG